MGPEYSFAPEIEPDAATIAFSNGIVLDTRAGEPELPADLRTDESAGGRLLRIIQFTGPMRQEWLRQLEDKGIRPFGYFHHYAVLAKLAQPEADVVRSLPGVRWVGVFQPAYKLQDVLLHPVGAKRIIILVTPGEDHQLIEAEIASDNGKIEHIMTTDFGTTITATVAAGTIARLAQLPEVFWVQEWTQASLCNNNGQWVMQTGWQASAPPDTSRPARRVWQRGVRGQGVIMSTTDTGLNLLGGTSAHNMFRDPSLPVTAPGIWPGHRKVVAYKLYAGASCTEEPYHGSHVNATIAGDDSVTGGTSCCDGMSIKGRLCFVDISDATGALIVPGDLTACWDTVYQGRGLPDSLRPIKQHSGSWGWPNSQGAYLLQDASTDDYCWRHKDFLQVFAAGNEGGFRTIRNPGIAKNVITVGAVQSGILANQIATFSSRGPTQDGRIKPTLCAPGKDVMSADRAGQATYQPVSGTSMATPMVNGTIGLFRDYLERGFYPTGESVAANRLRYVSAALLRAMAVVSADPNVDSYVVPGFDIGWGRLDADSALYFAGDARKLILKDDTTGLPTGHYQEEVFAVNSAIPLRAALAWTDTPAAPSANPALVNNINLELIAPDMTSYHGNQYSGGQSRANPANWDNRNVEECIRVNNPIPGIWRIRVYGYNVRTLRQPFAWAVTGDVSESNVGCTRIMSPLGTIDSGTVVTPACSVHNYGSSDESYTVRCKIGSAYDNTVSVTSHAPLATVAVTFPTWTALARGSHTVSCSTGLNGDMTPTNDQRIGPVTVRVLDVEAIAILAPTGIVDSGTGVTPQVRVRNNGTAAATFDARLDLGPSYGITQTVAALGPGDTHTVEFPAWIARPRGTCAAQCTVMLAGDVQAGNNRVNGTIAVRVADAEAQAIAAPDGGVDSGAVVTPRARVRNAGTGSETLRVAFTIQGGYGDTQTVSLPPAGDSVVSFNSWTATSRGGWATKCTVMLSSDMAPGNNRLAGWVAVGVADVQALSLIALPGVVDSGVSLNPQAIVRNNGSSPATFNVRLDIQGGYGDVQPVTALPAHDTDVVTFALWVANQRGSFAVRCTTQFAGDAVPANDLLTASVEVATHDIAAIAIVAPGETTPPLPSTPLVKVCNYGTERQPVQILLRITGTPYAATLGLSEGLPVGQDTTVSFPNWNATPGDFVAKCSTLLAGDQIPANNSCLKNLHVGNLDLAVSALLSPIGNIDTSAPIAPTARVENRGEFAATGRLYFSISGDQEDVYLDSAAVNGLLAGADTMVSFAQWPKPHVLADYVARCSVAAPGDVNSGNDTRAGSFAVVVLLPPRAWASKADLPLGPKAKRAKEGSALAYVPPAQAASCKLKVASYKTGVERCKLQVTSSELSTFNSQLSTPSLSLGSVYAFKGNGTCEFYGYDVVANTWTTREPIPVIGASGRKKTVRKGACLAASGSKLYAAKGNNTLEFWLYDPSYRSYSSYPWTQKADVPTGAKNVKEGAGAVFVTVGDSAYVYFLKGSGTQEFYRYDIAANVWEVRANAPPGVSGKFWKNGSRITDDGDNTIYALKGSYNEFYAYDVPTNTWITRNHLPLVGWENRKKKAKDGAGLAYGGGVAYCLKGGNTREFWSYDPGADTWTQLEDIPLGISSKKVKGGGALVFASNVNTLYALKGNNTAEFYSYWPDVSACGERRVTNGDAPDRPNEMSNFQLSAFNLKLAATPNPFSNATTISYSLPRTGNVSLKLYGVTGKLVSTLVSGYQPAGASSLILHPSSFSKGVYLVTLETEDLHLSRKLICQ
jgi:hypothetical protein